MSRIGTRIATIAAAAGGLTTAFLALNPTAAADPAAAPATPPASVPTATASFNLPQPPLSAPMNTAVGTVPAGRPSTPPASSGTLPLLSQLGLPSNLPGLNSLPLPNLGAPAASAVPGQPAAPAPAVPGQPALPPSLNPFSALP